LINVDVSASTGAFIGTVCLIAVHRSVLGLTLPLLSVTVYISMIYDAYIILAVLQCESTKSPPDIFIFFTHSWEILIDFLPTYYT